MPSVSVLEKIVDQKRREVAAIKQAAPVRALLDAVKPGMFAFSKALRKSGWSLIAECKLASPVKGRLSHRTVGELAGLYAANGAAALSVLTDSHFDGRLAHIEEAKAAGALPVLRKDFIIDEYQIYEAAAAGADAVLLIAAILTDRELSGYLAAAGELGLDCLVEVHSREELARVQQTPAGIIGINNRDLKTFATSIEKTFELLPYCEAGRLIISESGIRTGDDAARLKAGGVTGILVGEGLVTTPDIPSRVRELSLIK